MATTKKLKVQSKKVNEKNSQNQENNIVSKTTLDLIENAYTVYGKDIMWNSYQQGRAFMSADDGLKISYRHMLQTMLETTGSAMTKVQAILGENMKRYHFHGEGGAQEIVYALCNDYGCVECQGNSGARTMSMDMPGSAPRYVEARLKKEVREQLEKIMPFVPTEKTSTNFDEKLYIPTPIPLGLVAGSPVSMGVGLRCSIPAFTMKSLLDAYVNNDYSLLKASYGYTLGNPSNAKAIWDNTTNTTNYNIAEKEKPTKDNLEQLKSLWTTGYGQLILSIPVYRTTIDDLDGFMLVCDPALYKPKRSSKLEEWENNGWVEISDFSDNIGKLFIAKTKGTRKITDNDIYNELVRHCNVSKKITYELNIATEFITGKVGIYDWINHTYQNYTKLYTKYINKELDDLDFMERVWRNFRYVANDVIKYKKTEKSDKSIIDDCNNDKDQKKLQIGKDRYGNKMLFDCNEEVFKYISSKPIGTLRSEIDVQDRLRDIVEKRDYYNSINIDDEIEKYCSVWSN